jgi:dihydrofolate reductase
MTQHSDRSRSCRRRSPTRWPALAAANGKNVVVFGANLARQCLRQGLLDELVIHVAPVLLGDGVRLYESTGADPIVLTRTELAATGQLTDLRFRVTKEGN